MKINVCIINRHGRFQGFLTEKELTEAEANETVDTLIASVNNLRHLGLRHDDGSQSVFNEKILSESILQFNVTE